MLPGDSINVLYAGRLEREKGIELLADSFLLARREEPALRLVLAGAGSGEEYLRERLGDAAVFLGWLDREQLPRTYASADMFLFASTTDTFGQVIIEAQASGLPSSPQPPADRRRSSRTASTACCARRRRPPSPARSSISPAPRCYEAGLREPRSRARAGAPGSARSSGLRSATGARSRRPPRVAAARRPEGAAREPEDGPRGQRSDRGAEQLLVGARRADGRMTRGSPESARAPQRIAVALHDIEPATFERCALIRDWLDDHGIDRVTLLVIPARDLHPLGERSPEMVDWLRERERAGDAIAQHGFHHLRTHRAANARELLADLRATGVRARGGAEFLGLDATETRRAVESGRRLLKLAGIEPHGFVAPSYAYTPALRDVVRARFRWWAELLHLRRASAGGEERADTARRRRTSCSFPRSRSAAPDRCGGRSRPRSCAPAR